MQSVGVLRRALACLLALLGWHYQSTALDIYVLYIIQFSCEKKWVILLFNFFIDMFYTIRQCTSSSAPIKKLLGVCV